MSEQNYKIQIADGEQLARAHPSTFKIPPLAVRRSLGWGDLAKVVLTSDPLPPDSFGGERPWLMIIGSRGGRYVGRLESTLVAWPWCAVHKRGARLTFGPEHVVDVVVRSANPAVLEPTAKPKKKKSATARPLPAKRAPKKRVAKKRAKKKTATTIRNVGAMKLRGSRAPKLARKKKAIRPKKRAAKRVEKTSKRVASRAAKLLRSGSRAVRSVAGSALTQAPDRRKKRTKKRKTTARKR